MKKPLLAVSLLFIAACAKSPTYGTNSRDAVDSTSTNKQLKNESQDLSGAIDAIDLKSQQVGDLCDDLSDRISAFNDALAGRQLNLGTLMEQKDDIRNLLRPARDLYRQAVEDEAKSKGLIAGFNRLITYYGKASAAQAYIRVDKKQLGHDRDAEERKLRKALRAKNEAEYMSDAFDRAEADETAARAALQSIKAQLKALGTLAQATVAQNIKTLNDSITAEDPKLKDAQARKISTGSSVALFKGQLKAKMKEIAQLSKIDNLSPLDVPCACEAP